MLVHGDAFVYKAVQNVGARRLKRGRIVLESSKEQEQSKNIGEKNQSKRDRDRDRASEGKKLRPSSSHQKDEGARKRELWASYLQTLFAMKAAGDARNAPASVLQIFPPSVEFRNVELGKTYTATLKVKVRVVCVHYMKYNII